MKIVILILMILFSFKLLYVVSNIFQQNHYDIKKQLKSFRKIYFKKLYLYIYYLSLISSIIIVYYDITIIKIIAILTLIFAILFKVKSIIKLKITKRIIRLWITTIIIGMFFCLLSLMHILFLPIVLYPLLLLSNLINKPIENLISNHYIKKAKRKLEHYSNTKKVLITGSYGKTSTKYILDSILSSRYLSFKTPNSYNTLLGLSKTINENNFSSVEVFISEAGAFRLSEVEKISKFIKPNIAVITDVGFMHIETFKSIENVLSAKLEIIKGLSNDGILVLNFENDYLYEKAKEFDSLNIYSYGFNRGTFQARNISIINRYTSFDIYKNEEFIINLKTSLLGKHQILNILCSYTILEALNEKGMPIPKMNIYQEVKKLTPFEHRLSHYTLGNLFVLDNSYSSNLIGSKYAIEVLLSLNGLTAIITPGIVDEGSLEKEINKMFASNLLNINEICLIKNKAITSIIDFLEEKEKNYQVFNSFKEAFQYILKLSSNISINLLIENDLPDSFIER